jgi:hypothetical protein
MLEGSRMTDVAEEVLEFDLDEEELHDEVKFLAMTRYYSGKKYNARGLFEEMKVAWGLHGMKLARVLGDNKFMLEFESEEIRRRVVEGGWGLHDMKLARVLGDNKFMLEFESEEIRRRVVEGGLGDAGEMLCLWCRMMAYRHRLQLLSFPLGSGYVSMIYLMC